MYGYDKQNPHLGGFIIGGDPNTYSTEVWDYVISKGVRSIIDVGCGQGYAVKYFRDNGVECIGVEGCKEAIDTSVAREFIISHDFTKGIPNITKQFDAAWCCEFVEHIEEIYVENFLSVFDKCKSVYMTHGVPGQDGYYHVNCQHSSYWIKLMEERGFIYDDSESIKLRHLTDKMHVKNTLMYFYKVVES